MKKFIAIIGLFSVLFMSACVQTKPVVDKINAPAKKIIIVDVDVPNKDTKLYWDNQGRIGECANTNEAGCIRFLMFESPRKNEKFFIYEEYVDADAVKAHQASPHYAEGGRLMRTLYPDVKSNVREFDVVEPTGENELFAVIDFELPEKDLVDFLKNLKELRDATNKEEGCIAYEFYQYRNNPNRVFLFEWYKNKAAHKAHVETPHFKKWAKIRKTLGKEITKQVKFYEVKSAK